MSKINESFTLPDMMILTEGNITDFFGIDKSEVYVNGLHVTLFVSEDSKNITELFESLI